MKKSFACLDVAFLLWGCGHTAHQDVDDVMKAATIPIYKRPQQE